MMRRELRCEGLVGRARRAMARSIEGTRSFYSFKLLVSSYWFPVTGFQLLVSSYWFPVTGFQLLVSFAGFQLLVSS